MEKIKAYLDMHKLPAVLGALALSLGAIAGCGANEQSGANETTETTYTRMSPSGSLKDGWVGDSLIAKHYDGREDTIVTTVELCYKKDLVEIETKGNLTEKGANPIASLFADSSLEEANVTLSKDGCSGVDTEVKWTKYKMEEGDTEHIPNKPELSSYTCLPDIEGDFGQKNLAVGIFKRQNKGDYAKVFYTFSCNKN